MKTSHPSKISPPAAAPAAWPDEVADLTFPSTADGTAQPMRFYAPPAGGRPAPLLVYLHPWSTTYQFGDHVFYARHCIQRGWAACFPDFRGPNSTPAACGSELAVQDILDAAAYARSHAAIDERRIYLLGASGGGYAALLMAGRAPNLWAAVSAWVPIYDLKDWHAYWAAKGGGYARQMEAACGGPPGASPAVDEEYRKRSASAWLARAAGVTVDIAAGINDRAIPIAHSLLAFNVLARPEDRLDPADIEQIDRERRIPERLHPAAAAPAPLAPGRLVNGLTPAEYAERVRFRRCSGSVRVTLFEGAHDIVSRPALEFLACQEKGQPPVWT